MPNCYHSICPYVLVSGVVDKPTSTFPLNGREVQLLSVKVVAHLSDVTASSPQSVTYGWHIRILSYLRNVGRRILNKPTMVENVGIEPLFHIPNVECKTITLHSPYWWIGKDLNFRERIISPPYLTAV